MSPAPVVAWRSLHPIPQVPCLRLTTLAARKLLIESDLCPSCWAGAALRQPLPPWRPAWGGVGGAAPWEPPFTLQSTSKSKSIQVRQTRPQWEETTPALRTPRSDGGDEPSLQSDGGNRKPTHRGVWWQNA